MGYSPWGCEESDTTEATAVAAAAVKSLGPGFPSVSIVKVTTPCELPTFPTDTPVRESLFRQIGKVTWGMLVKRENKGSGGIADVTKWVKIEFLLIPGHEVFFPFFPKGHTVTRWGALGNSM